MSPQGIGSTSAPSGLESRAPVIMISSCPPCSVTVDEDDDDDCVARGGTVSPIFRSLRSSFFRARLQPKSESDSGVLRSIARWTRCMRPQRYSPPLCNAKRGQPYNQVCAARGALSRRGAKLPRAGHVPLKRSASRPPDAGCASSSRLARRGSGGANAPAAASGREHPATSLVAAASDTTCPVPAALPLAIRVPRTTRRHRSTHLPPPASTTEFSPSRPHSARNRDSEGDIEPNRPDVRGGLAPSRPPPNVSH